MSDIIYDFGSGRSDPGTFPTEALQRAAVTASEKEAVTLTDYPGGLGYPGEREPAAEEPLGRDRDLRGRTDRPVKRKPGARPAFLPFR